MSMNKVKEWAMFTTKKESIAQAIEASMVAYKENDADTIQVIMNNAMEQVANIEREFIKNNDFNGIKLTEQDKELLLKARMRFEITKCVNTLARLIEDYEMNQLLSKFGIED